MPPQFSCVPLRSTSENCAVLPCFSDFGCFPTAHFLTFPEDKLNTKMCEIGAGGVERGLRVFKASGRAPCAAAESGAFDAGAAFRKAPGARLRPDPQRPRQDLGRPAPRLSRRDESAARSARKELRRIIPVKPTASAAGFHIFQRRAPTKPPPQKNGGERSKATACSEAETASARRAKQCCTPAGRSRTEKISR